METKLNDDGFNEGEALLYAVNKTAERTKKDTIDKACKWLSDYFVFKHEAMSAQGCDAFLHEFRKAMGDRYEE